jgi:type II secretory pathway component PulF
VQFETIQDEKAPVVLTPLQAPARAGFKLQHIMFGVLVCAFLMWLWVAAWVWLIVLLFFAVVLGAVGTSVYFVRRNLVQQETLLWALAIASERSLPLAPAALAFADQYGSTFRWRIQLLAGLISRGAPLAEALEQVPNLLRREAQVLVWCGAATRTLPKALREAAGLKSERMRNWGWVAARFAYLLTILLLIETSLGYLTWSVAPRFTAIIRDFGVEMPPATALMIQAGEYLFGDHFAIALCAVALQVLVLLLIPLSVFNVFEWNIPFLDSLFRRRHALLVLRGLALAVGGERPISEGFAVLARCYPSSWVRSRLKLVDRDVRGGEHWVRSLRDRGLVRPIDAAVLASAERVGNLEWALRETAAAGERRIGYRLNFWLQFLYPVVLLAMSVLVLVMSLACFTPLIAIIEVLQK